LILLLHEHARRYASKPLKPAAPYVHARLQTTTLAGDPEKPQHKVVIEFVKAGGQVEVSQC
jgi:hypothetical protein